MSNKPVKDQFWSFQSPSPTALYGKPLKYQVGNKVFEWHELVNRIYQETGETGDKISPLIIEQHIKAKLLGVDVKVVDE